MTPKTERFEMRLDEQTLANVDGWRSLQNDLPSRAEAIRRLIDLGLARDTIETAPGDTIRFSDGERLIVTMLRDLYKHLKVDGEIDPAFIGDVIFGGHDWALKWEMQGLFHDHKDDPQDVHFVFDVLQMWDRLERSYEKLSKKDKEVVAKEAKPFGTHVEFDGFDGNNETFLMAIARFVVNKMGRFEKFKDRELNSHSPRLDVYKRMLDVFEPLSHKLSGGYLDATQVSAILKAQTYPGAPR